MVAGVVHDGNYRSQARLVANNARANDCSEREEKKNSMGRTKPLLVTDKNYTIFRTTRARKNNILNLGKILLK